MAATSPLVLGLIGANAAACLTSIYFSSAIKKRLQEQHAALWAGLAFPLPRFFGTDSSDAADESAQLRYTTFIRSGHWRKLNDERLETLVRRHKACFWVFCCTMTACLVGFLFEYLRH